jgi:hypothetical protein
VDIFNVIAKISRLYPLMPASVAGTDIDKLEDFEEKIKVGQPTGSHYYR